MDPQWNMFQQPLPEKVVMDYNRIVSQNRPNYSTQPSSYGSYGDYHNQFQSIPKQTQKYNAMGPPDYSNYSNYLPATSHSQNSMNFMQEPHYSPMPSSDYYSESSRASQYTPPPPDFKIGTFTLDSTMTNESMSNNSQSTYNQSNSISANQSTRETGIIEKLLQTYGFIQCCERQARLFFHFSQFEGNTEHLRIGDPVEFEVTFDKRTGKPIASSVTKISPEVVLSEERVIGCVTTELKNESSGEHQGRITYENRGECFFLPYGKDDVEGYVTLKPGDKVSFQIATNQRSGNLGSRHVRLENPSQPVKYQGVVSAIKESYGFIERADVVDEIFFHFSEAKCIPDGLKLGDDVEFLIQSHNGKEVATGMVKLSSGTVVFEDVNNEEMKGQVLKPVEKMQKQTQKDPLTGRIRYRGQDRSEVEVKFGERDQKGDFTLKHGDWVKFNIATDRRDRLQKATNISLLDDSFYVSGEKREMGIICILKEDFGFIKCADRDSRMHFSYDELLDPQIQLNIDDEVQFTVINNQMGQSANRQTAIRIRKLQSGTVKFEVLIQEDMEGEVMIEPSLISKSPTNVNPAEENIQPGIITYTIDNVKQTVNYYLKNFGTKGPQVGDSVIFNMYLIKRTKERIATGIKIVTPLITSITPNPGGSIRQSMVGSGRTFDRGSTNLCTASLMAMANECDTYPAQMDALTHKTSLPDNNMQTVSSVDTVKRVECSQVYSMVERSNIDRTHPYYNSSESNGNDRHQIFPNAETKKNNPTQVCPTAQEPERCPTESMITNVQPQIFQTVNTNLHGNKHFGSSDNHSFSLKDLQNTMPGRNNAFLQSDSKNFPIKDPHRNEVSNNHNSISKDNHNNIPNYNRNSILNEKRSSISNENRNSIYNEKCSSISNENRNTIFHEKRSSISNDKNSSIASDVRVLNATEPRNFAGREIPGDASNGNLDEAAIKVEPTPKGSFGQAIQAPLQRGFIAALKENFGFVETLHHDKEIFFHFSNVDGDSSNLDIGSEVEYTIAVRTGPGGKLSAEKIRLLPIGSIPSAKILGEVFEGTVLRSMRSANPDQHEYCGMLCVGKKEAKPLRCHQFGITGLANKKELLQPNDQVTFQLDDDGWAVNICAIRKKLIAIVEAVKGQYGFLNYEPEEGKKLFFHQTEVKDGITLSPGDEVEFVIITNQKTAKSAACNITRLAVSANSAPRQRPDRLVSKLRGLALDSSKPRLQIVRQPKGPDGTKGFKLERKLTENK